MTSFLTLLSLAVVPMMAAYQGSKISAQSSAYFIDNRQAVGSGAVSRIGPGDLIG